MQFKTLSLFAAAAATVSAMPAELSSVATSVALQARATPSPANANALGAVGSTSGRQSSGQAAAAQQAQGLQAIGAQAPVAQAPAAQQAAQVPAAQAVGAQAPAGQQAALGQASNKGSSAQVAGAQQGSTNALSAAGKTTGKTSGSQAQAGQQDNKNEKSGSGASSGKPMAVYWGQNSGDPDLGDLCKEAGVEIVILSFITGFGGGKSITSNFGKHCGDPQNCPQIASGMKACRAAGKKVFISIGGASNKGTFKSKSEAEGLADGLWGAFGPPSAKTAGTARVFGEQYVDGFDFDLENPNDVSLPYYPDLINRLRSHFAGGAFQISGAPMCSLKGSVMANMINKSKFDKLFVQFYNDACAARGSQFNLDSLPNVIAGGASSGAQLFVGLPASPDGSGVDSSFYLEPPKLEGFLNKWKGDASFAGVMLWDAGHAATNKNNGCDYMGQVNKVLTTGKAC